jgi:8-oxo-dGTP pyrophosphatase MutT (NUDIX family)
MAEHLVRFERQASPLLDLKPASVALCVVTVQGEASLLITRRSAGLRVNAGQWALPGGRREAGESVEAAARRELFEETALEIGESGVLGVLDDYVARSGHLITPVVLWGGEVPDELSGPESEVASVHLIPLVDFDVEPRLITIPESDAPVIQLPLLGRYVHAPTAAIIYQFCQVALHGMSTRVAHFEQPVFAWT